MLRPDAERKARYRTLRRSAALPRTTCNRKATLSESGAVPAHLILCARTETPQEQGRQTNIKKSNPPHPPLLPVSSSKRASPSAPIWPIYDSHYFSSAGSRWTVSSAGSRWAFAMPEPSRGFEMQFPDADKKRETTSQVPRCGHSGHRAGEGAFARSSGQGRPERFQAPTLAQRMVALCFISAKHDDLFPSRGRSARPFQ